MIRYLDYRQKRLPRVGASRNTCSNGFGWQIHLTRGIVACADFEPFNAARRSGRLMSVHARIEEGTTPQKPLESLN
jgi:hypothetical protein